MVCEENSPRPLTPVSTRFRYGGLALAPERRLLLAVREDHDARPEERSEIVALSLDSDNAGGGHVLVTGADFYAGPALRDGQLAWFQWMHPNMSWVRPRCASPPARMMLQTAYPAWLPWRQTQVSALNILCGSATARLPSSRMTPVTGTGE